MKADLRFCEAYKDMYNIYYLITKINKNYKLFFDKKTQEYLIVNSAKNNQICLKTKQITPNILKLLQISRVERLSEIIKNIDDENEILMQKNAQNFKNNMTDAMLETISFSKRVNSISNKDIKRILGEKIC